MRLRHFLMGLAVASLGCSSPTVAVAPDLTGRWQSPRESLQSAGSYQTTLTFQADGRMTVDVRSYGLYSFQRPDDLSFYSRLTGTFRTDGASLIIQGKKLVSWDRFYGADSPEQVVNPYSGTAFPQAQYSIEANRLTIRYITAPLDAPIETTATFVRVE